MIFGNEMLRRPSLGATSLKRVYKLKNKNDYFFVYLLIILFCYDFIIDNWG